MPRRNVCGPDTGGSAREFSARRATYYWNRSNVPGGEVLSRTGSTYAKTKSHQSLCSLRFWICVDPAKPRARRNTGRCVGFMTPARS
jgi:hypothetical protein